jgi:hypothetical protein
MDIWIGFGGKIETGKAHDLLGKSMGFSGVDFPNKTNPG